jgi:hypothetical protein
MWRELEANLAKHFEQEKNLIKIKKRRMMKFELKEWWKSLPLFVKTFIKIGIIAGAVLSIYKAGLVIGRVIYMIFG